MVKVIFGGGFFMDADLPGSYGAGEKAAEAMDVLLAHGVTTIYTACIYTGSEEAIGKQEKRAEFTIDTKVPGGFSPGAAHKDTILRHEKEALDNVNIKQFDILYMHAPDPYIPLDDTLAGIHEAHKAGIFQRFGLSNYSAEDVQREVQIPCPALAPYGRAAWC